MGVSERSFTTAGVSHSLSGTVGETMSPVILPVALKEPSQAAGFSGGGGGAIWAIGSPLRVTRIGLHVRFTFVKRARQVALNLETDTSSSTALSYHDYGP